MEFEAVIGLEVHAQLLTQSKLFCSCSIRFGAKPNTQTCPVCLGLPGVLPVLNEQAVNLAIRAGLALNCEIQHQSIWARKNYFYPDLPKGYQISQYEKPLALRGHLDIMVNNKPYKIRITRIHMEEDAGKLLHEHGDEKSSHVDLNRAGTPLVEIVSEPDIRSASEAGEYLRSLRAILQYCDVCDGNMEEGSLRCDANVSIRPIGQKEFGTRTELKNINSFRYVEKAIEYEIKRQRACIEAGEKIVQETRLWDSARNVTEPMRSKEHAHDYRYFPDPDLVPLILSDEQISEIKKNLPELPKAMVVRFIKDYQLSDYDAGVLTSEKPLARFFESAISHHNQWHESQSKSGLKDPVTSQVLTQQGSSPKPAGVGDQPKAISNWIQTELLRLLKDSGKSIETSPVTPLQVANLLRLVDEGTISGKIAKTVFEEMFQTGKDANIIIKEKNLVQVSDSGALEKIIDTVIAANPKQLEQYRSGKDKLFGFFVGQVMKETKGQGNPNMINDLLKKKLSS